MVGSLGGRFSIYACSTLECVDLALSRWTMRAVRHLALVFALCSPPLVLTLRCWRVLDRRSRASAVLCLAAGARMFVLGFDFLRWLGNLWLCNWLMLAIAASREGAWVRISGVMQRSQTRNVLALASCLSVGPIGWSCSVDPRRLDLEAATTLPQGGGGVAVDPPLHAEDRDRIASLDLPSVTAFA